MPIELGKEHHSDPSVLVAVAVADSCRGVHSTGRCKDLDKDLGRVESVAVAGNSSASAAGVAAVAVVAVAIAAALAADGVAAPAVETGAAEV